MTLVELMIVLTIIGLLAVVAFPAYRDYTVRSKVIEAVMAAGACRSAVMELVSAGGAASAATLGQKLQGLCPSGARYVESISISPEAVILVRVGNLGFGASGGNQFVLVPYVDAEGLQPFNAETPWLAIAGWRCGPAPTDPLDERFLPSSCRG